MKKNICFFVDSIFSLGGIQRVVTSLCNELCNDYNITVISQYDVNSNQRVDYGLNKSVKTITIDNNLFYIDKLIFAPIRGIRFLINKFKIKNRFSKIIMNYDYKIFKRRRLIKYLNNQKIDYVLCTGMKNCIYISKLKNKINSKIIGCWHSSFENYYSDYSNDEILGTLKNLDKTIVLTKHDAKQVKQYYNIDVNQIYNFISNNPIDKSSLKNKTFLTVGRYDEIKGYDRMIRLFSEFYKNNKDWELLLVGEGSERPNLQKIIDDLNLNQCVKLTGKTDNVEKYYKEATVFLMTSYGEGFPMVIVEAMKYGLPIVAYDIPVLHEMLPNDDFIIPQDDSKKFVNAMNKLAEDEKLRKKISTDNIEKCKDFYVENIINKWNKVLK